MFRKFSSFLGKSIKKNILLIGGGRWSKILITEIYKNFKNIKIIFVFTRSKKKFEKWAINKNIKRICILKKLSLIKKKKCNFAIVANKNKDHFRFILKLIDYNFNILVEKPFIKNLKNFNKIYKLSKKKKLFILVSLQFMYSRYFFFIKKFLKKKKIFQLEFDWYDKNSESRYGFPKIHDKSIHYAEDIFYHVYSILFLFLGCKKIKFRKIEKEKLFLYFGKCKIVINFSRQANIRKRRLKINYNKKNNLIINFNEDRKIIVYINSKIFKIPSQFCDTTLKYQLFFFLKLKSYKKEILFNDIRKLKIFFESLKKLRQIIKKTI